MSEHEDLMAELQGEEGVSVKSDPKPQETNPNPFETAKTDQRTAAGGRGYAVSVRGEFRALVTGIPGGKKTVKTYEAVVNVPRLEGCQAVIRRKLIEPVLRQKYGEEFTSVRTCEIVDVKPLNPNMPASTDLRFMSHGQLVEYARTNKVPIAIEEYTDAAALRDVLIEYTVNPKGFEKREAERHATRVEKAELQKINPNVSL